MKFPYFVVICLVAFNFMILFSSSIGVFNTNYWSAQSVGSYDNYNVTGNESLLLKFVFGFGDIGGISITAITLGIVTLSGALALAYFTNSPVPLAIGSFAALFTSLWVQTSPILIQLNIPFYLYSAGTVGVGIMTVISGIEMLGGGNTQ